jgi:hypothetical protein
MTEYSIKELVETLRFYADTETYLAGGYGSSGYAPIFSDRGDKARAVLGGHSPASAIEARRAATEGAVHESAVAKPDAKETI